MKDQLVDDGTDYGQDVSEVESTRTNCNQGECQRKFQRASEHIITQRTLLHWHWFSTTPTQSVELEIQELSKLVDELLEAYKEYFDSVLEREPWNTDNALRGFERITEEVLHRDEEQYNWTRIAMLLALATRLSQHFYKKGASGDFVKQFSRDVGSCIESRVNTWAHKDNRWESLRPETSSAMSSSKIYTCLFGAGAFVLSFLATVLKFSTSTPVFISRLRT